MKLKRYKNRALYDVERQAWVKLSAVARAIRAGEEVTATHARSGKDCTALVLLQLLWERAMRGEALPAKPLLELVRGASGSGSEAFRRLSEGVLAEERGKRR